MDTRFARWTPGLIAALLVAGCATPSGGGGGSSGSPSPSSSDSSGTSGTGGGAGLPSAGTPSTPGGTTPGGTTPGGTTPDGGAAGRGAEVPTGTAQTPDERRAAVDRRLDESMGEFDERIRKEQEGVAKERDSRAGAGADTVAGAEESGDATGSEAAGGKPGDLKSDRAGSGNAGEGGKGDSSGPARTSAGTGGTGKGAIERPDGSDDDIVARRLRRAAEQETDPELKEKLWKEYADYKKSVQGG